MLDDEPTAIPAHEWVHHTALGKQAGMTDEDIVAVQTGDGTDEFGRVVLTAVDELQNQFRVTEATWTALGERLDERQRMDLIFTAGGYGVPATAPCRWA